MYRDDQWSGPAVVLMQTVASTAGFTINLTDAPQWVYDSAGSNADAATQCIYAVSLGYLDICGGLFTITRNRLALTSMVTTSPAPLYLVSKMEEEAMRYVPWVPPLPLCSSHQWPALSAARSAEHSYDYRTGRSVLPGLRLHTVRPSCVSYELCLV